MGNFFNRLNLIGVMIFELPAVSALYALLIVPLIRSHGIPELKKRYELTDELCDLLESALTEPTHIYDIFIYLKNNTKEASLLEELVKSEKGGIELLEHYTVSIVPDSRNKLQSYKLVLDHLLDISYRLNSQLVVKSFFHDEHSLSYVSNGTTKFSSSFSKRKDSLVIPIQCKVYIESFENEEKMEAAYIERQETIRLSDSQALEESFLKGLKTLDRVYPNYLLLERSDAERKAESRRQLEDLLEEQHTTHTYEKTKHVIHIDNITSMVQSVQQQIETSNNEIADLREIVSIVKK